MKVMKILTRNCRLLILTVMILVFLFMRVPIKAHAKAENTYNVLLIGSDRRDTSWNGNSDAMVLVTINEDTEKIYLTSFMRDSYAEIPGYGVNKLNYAYAVGGSGKLRETLEYNYGVKIDHYVSADFTMMAKLVDFMGGVDAYIKDNEIIHVNKLSAWMEKTYGISAGTPVQSEGNYHLNGAQTVSYSRIRKVGNGDFERCERQWRVLKSLRDATNYLSMDALKDMIKELLLMTNNDIIDGGEEELFDVVEKARYWDVVETRIPFDDSFYMSNEMLVPNDMWATAVRLEGIIYADGNKAEEEAALEAGTDDNLETPAVSENGVDAENDNENETIEEPEYSPELLLEVQRALNEFGYDCGEPDGLWGPMTAQSVLDFQEQNDLEMSGEIDDALLSVMGIAR